MADIDYPLMNQLLFEGKSEEIKKMSEDALTQGHSARDILNKGLIAGMNVVGEDFKRNRVYLPEVVIAARAMKAGMEVLNPLLTQKGSGQRSMGTLVMGTVKGDLHDIGKNLVLMMAEGAGFKCINLGVNTSVEKYIQAIREHKADILGMSALLTTTMTYMKVVVDELGHQGLGHVKVCVGGAPLNQMFADEIGADGYAPDAASAVELFKSLMAAQNAQTYAELG